MTTLLHTHMVASQVLSRALRDFEHRSPLADPNMSALAVALLRRGDELDTWVQNMNDGLNVTEYSPGGVWVKWMLSVAELTEERAKALGVEQDALMLCWAPQYPKGAVANDTPAEQRYAKTARVYYLVTPDGFIRKIPSRDQVTAADA